MGGYHGPGDRDHTAIMAVFSTITSPVFSELAIVVAGHTVICLPWAFALFETLRKMNEVRPFKLVFIPEISDFYLENVRRELAEALDSVIEKGLLNFLDSPPTIR